MTAPKITDLALATRTLDEAGGACPYQARGTILGEAFYFRFRNDSASLQIGDADTVVLHGVTGDSYAGSLTEEQFETLFRRLLKDFLKSLKV